MAEFETYNSSLILSGGRSKAQNACASPWVIYALNQGSTCSENHTALRIAYNYQFNPILGLEISYGDLGNATGAGTSSNYGTPSTWSMKAIGWAFAGTVKVPMGGGFSLLGKLGSVRAEFSENIHTTDNTGAIRGGTASTFNGVPIINGAKNALTYGIGLQYELNKQFAIRAQYENFGKYDMYGAYGLFTSYGIATPPRIALSVISAGIVLKF
jgi:OOP family OmpA-OmpF porin